MGQGKEKVRLRSDKRARVGGGVLGPMASQLHFCRVMFKGLQGIGGKFLSPWEQAPPDWSRNPSCQKAKLPCSMRLGGTVNKSCLGHQGAHSPEAGDLANIDVKKVHLHLEGSLKDERAIGAKRTEKQAPNYL